MTDVTGRSPSLAADTVVVKFRVLGPLGIETAGGSIPIPGVRVQRMLAVLLLNANTPVAYERLVDALWDDPPRSVRQQVHTTVNCLRRFLAAVSPQATIATVESGYEIQVDENLVDEHRFRLLLAEADESERLGRLDDALCTFQRALQLWRGSALAGITSQHIVNVAARLNELRITTIERVMTIRLHQGETSSLISELMELVTEHPYREKLRANLMEALYRNGRQADALAVYEQGRELLAESFGIDPGVALRRLHLEILRNEVDLRPGAAGPDTREAVRPAHQPQISGPDTSRNFLPPDTAEFTGRHAEVAQLSTKALTPSGKALVISAIDGMGGVGKTALAVHLAHELTEHYPEGQYFVDLHGFSAGRNPLTSEEALDDLLRQAGVPVDDILTDLARRSALWRSKLAGRRALLLLDNASDAAQVRPLIPGTADVLVIVTSRRRLTALEGNVPLSLDVLPFADALALFTQIVGEDRLRSDIEGVRTAIELCGRLPLAIRIAAARFRDRASWTVADMVEQLRVQDTRARFLAVGDRDVMAVLGLSYRQLEPAQQRIFRLLSLHPGEDFDAYAVAALADAALAETEQALDVLYDDSLLLQHVPGRYRFHDLVRDCSGDLRTGEDDDETTRTATHRLLDYYLYVALTGCRPTDKSAFQFEPEIAHPPRQVSPRASGSKPLRAEYHNIVAAAEFAVRSGWHSHAWQISCAVRPFLAEMNYDPRGQLLIDLAEQAVRGFRDARLAVELTARGASLDRQAEEPARSRGRTVNVRGCQSVRPEPPMSQNGLPPLVALPAPPAAALCDKDAHPHVEEQITRCADALHALRVLSHDFLSSQLKRSGLGPSLRTLVERRVPQASLHVDAGVEQRRFPPEVEAAMYFCSQEAVRAAGSPLALHVASTDGQLRLELVAPLPRSSVQTMLDRVEAVGGRLYIDGDKSANLVQIAIPVLP